MLTISMMVSCKASSIAFTITATDTVSLDSVKKLIPRGYYILNEQGARLSIKTKIDLDAITAKWAITDEQLSKRNGDIMLITIDRDRYRQQSQQDKETIRLLKRSLFWANFWKYSALATTAILGVKLLIP